jgi:hypothetical protein
MACDSWEAASSYSNAVFSEDGAGIAAVLMDYEQQNAYTHMRERGHSTQVLMKENLDSSVPAVLTPSLDGAVRDIFFMRDAGYIILGRHTDEVELTDGSSERDIWYDKIELDGTVSSIVGGTHLTMLSCDGGTSATATSGPLMVIPSPDGTVLAQFEAETDCSGSAQTLTFLDASDLSTIDGPHSVAEAPMSAFMAPIELAWTDEDVFAVGYWGTSSTADSILVDEYTVDGALEEDVERHMSCFYPPTTSSSTNADEDMVEIDGSTGAISISAALYDAPYGCDE